jgi:hypothetical protein
MASPLEQPEVGRRIRAAMSYGRLSRTDAAKIFCVSTGHLDKYIAQDPTYMPEDVQQLRELAIAAGLDPNWFTADLDRLTEIRCEGLPLLAKAPVDPASVAEHELVRIEQPPTADAQDQEPPKRKGRGG